MIEWPKFDRSKVTKDVPDVWFASDHHLDHHNILKFVNDQGKRVRPEFSSTEEMNETMLSRHNSLVSPNDKVYFLGDVGFNQNTLDKLLPKFNGRKRLILGNHDGYKMSFYERHFQKILVSWRPIYGLVFSHYPLFISDDDTRMLANVHGHIHREQIGKLKYLNISVEETDYYPVHFTQIVELFKRRGIEFETARRKD